MQTASLQAPDWVPGAAGAALDARDWGHLPPVAVQALGRHCCPASKAKLRLICRSWHDALANQFPDVWLGPGGAWAAGSGVAAVCRAFPAAARLHLISSSTRDYAGSHTQDLAQLLSSLPSLTHLSLQELHELEDFDNLDPASLWDALAAAAPALGPRLVSLAVSGCFWGCPELFGGLCELTSLTQLRLLNNPLETACEVNIIAGLSQLRVLEFGLIFDGSSQHHDVPRALEGISRLTLLEELSLPMWRRSLGGRAHPLAPSLAAALRQLTQLTSLAVDGKFGHLGVVSHLTKLRRLASAAPLSASGWEAISKLPALTLLTSLTPAGEALQVNPARPHSGLDLGLLAGRSCLTGLDVAVMQPEHLATLGQFTQLQTLTLRAASTFLQERQQALLLTALSCLPAGLTSLTLGPLLPLSPQLLAAIAHSCPVLQSLQARFEAVALGATSAPGAAAAATAAAAAAGLMPGLSPGGSIDGPTALPPGAAAAVAAAAAAGIAQGSEFGSEADTTASGQRPPSRCSFEAGPSSSSISSALRRLRLLRSLELVLLEQAAGSGNEQDVPGGDTGWQQQWYRAASTRTSATGAAGMGPSVQLFMADLPPRLQHLVLAGPFQLCTGSSAAARASRAAPSRLAAVGPQQQLQQQQPERSACSACGGTPAAAACQPSSSSAAAAVKLCECFSGIRLSSATAAGRPPQPLAALGAASGAAAAAAAGSAAAWDPAGHHSRLLSGLKRPGSYPSINAATGSSSVGASDGARAQSSEVAAGLPAGLPRPEQLGASARPGHAVFVLEEPGCLEKRSRSYCSFPPAADASQQPVAAGGQGAEAAAAAPAAAGSGGLSTAVAGASMQAEQQQQQQQSEDGDSEVDGMLVDDAAEAEAAAAPSTAGAPGEEIALELQQQQQAAQQQQEQRVPVLSELCLYKCQLSFCALQQLVASAGPGLSKLQLLRLRISPSAQQQQQQQQAAGRGSSSGGAAVAPTELSAHQLQQLPVAWAALQEWHLHPHHLWGLVMSGCFSSSKHRRSSSSSSFGSSDAAAEQTASTTQQQQQQRLQNVSQLLNLRHLSVVSRLPAGAAGGCDAADSDRPKGGDEPVTPLPLHSPPAMQQLLAQLQAGLQQLPALRQLQLDLGHVAPEQPGLQDACGDIWAEAGEQLLEVLPACRVQHRAPLVWPAAGSVAAGEGSGAAAGAAAAGQDMLADGGAAIGSSSDDEFMLDYVI